jgi:hypothetical protein
MASHVQLGLSSDGCHPSATSVGAATNKKLLAAASEERKTSHRPRAQHLLLLRSVRNGATPPIRCEDRTRGAALGCCGPHNACHHLAFSWFRHAMVQRPTAKATSTTSNSPLPGNVQSEGSSCNNTAVYIGAQITSVRMRRQTSKLVRYLVPTDRPNM